MCNNKRCPGKTCEGEKQGRSWYAGPASGTRACVTRVYKAYCADPREKVALADLVEMGVCELDGRDPKTQVDVERDDLLKYTGKVGLCDSCRVVLLSDPKKHDEARRKATHKCTDPFNKGCTGKASGSQTACLDCKAEQKRRAALARGAL